MTEKGNEGRRKYSKEFKVDAELATIKWAP